MELSTSPLSKFIWGEQRLERRSRLLDVLTKNPVLNSNVQTFSLSRRDLWAMRAQQGKELIDLRFKLGWSRQDFLDALRLVGDSIPVYAQFWIFVKNLEAQMSPEQQAYWVPKAERFEICGCYAQTELAHGSNLHGIETTASFDQDTDEFVLHSPTLSSTKFWIGSLGCWATHAIVVARLILRGKDLGNHLFLAQVRDLDTQEVMPNVSIYDHGEKALGGLPGIDNGAMRFNHYRIPRSHMFAGAASVERDGRYRAANNPQHSLTSMVIVRGTMCDELGFDLAKAMAIAINYTTFRRQFGAKVPGGEETRVIDYASVRQRLLTMLAKAVTLILTGRQIRELVVDTVNVRTDLKDLHIQTVGCKVYASEQTARGVEVARLACGGHGMLASAGLGTMYANISASRTYEGESFVISSQVGKQIVKLWSSPTKLKMPAMSYLERLRDPTFRNAKLRRMDGPDSWLNQDIQLEMLERRAAILAARHLADTKLGRDTSFSVFELTMAHGELVYWRNLQAQLLGVPAESKDAMQSLAQVFSLTALLEGLSTFAGDQFLSYTDIELLRTAQADAVDKFSHFVPIILDAFSFTDYELKSTLSRRNQSPYEAIMEEAKRSPLNNAQFIHPTIISARSLWKKYTKPSL